MKPATPLLHVFICTFGLDNAQRLMIAFLTLILQTNKNITAYCSLRNKMERNEIKRN